MNTKDFRKKHGITQRELSALLPCPKRTIEDWEGNKSTPPEYLKRALDNIEEHDLKNETKGKNDEA